MTTFTQVQEVLATTLKLAPAAITPTSTAKEIPAWDSLAHVRLMIGLEQTFDLQLDVEDFEKLVSVPAILAFLKERGVE